MTENAQKQGDGQGGVDWRAFLRDWNWLREHSLQAASLFGVAAYGSLRYSSGTFYRELGFRPEEVGLGYVEILGLALFGSLSSLVALASLLILVTFVAFGAVRLWRRVRRKAGDPSPPRFRDRLFDLSWKVVKGATLALWPLLFVATPILAGYEGSTVASGSLISPLVPRFVWPAEAAIVHLHSQVPGLGDGQCILFLGHSDGVLALYDPRTRWSIRVASSDVTLLTGGRLRGITEVPDDC